MRVISWLAEELLASQEGLCCTELERYIIVLILLSSSNLKLLIVTIFEEGGRDVRGWSKKLLDKAKLGLRVFGMHTVVAAVQWSSPRTCDDTRPGM
jgi:hypothetical protein